MKFSWSMGQFMGSAITDTLQKIYGVAPSLFKFEVSTIVSQLSKCLKFKSIRGDKNDSILYKITP